MSRHTQEDYDRERERAEKLHGVGRCQKVEHDGRTGHLHDSEDDSPYVVDSLRYCGRCHWFLGAEKAMTADNPQPPCPACGSVTRTADHCVGCGHVFDEPDFPASRPEARPPGAGAEK
jgi:hypothetical protein